MVDEIKPDYSKKRDKKGTVKIKDRVCWTSEEVEKLK
jgi:hypothetical protein